MPMKPKSARRVKRRINGSSRASTIRGATKRRSGTSRTTSLTNSRTTRYARTKTRSRTSGSTPITWKRFRRSASGKKLSQAIAFIILLTVSSLFLSGLLFYKNLTKNFASAYSPGIFLLNEKDIFSLLYITVDDFSSEPLKVEKIEMTLIDKKGGRVTRYNVSPRILIDIPGRFGEEEVSKSFALGALSGSGGFGPGIDLTAKTISKLVGYKVDKYIVVDSDLSDQFDEFFSTGNLNIGFSFGEVSELRNSLKTDFTFNEFFDTYKFIKGLPVDRMVLKDYTEVHAADPDIVDKELRDMTFDSKLALEKQTIAVLNGAEISGLATFASRNIENMGGRIVGVGNAAKVYEKSVLIAEDISTESVRSMAHTFQISTILSKEQAADFTENDINRADIVLILGLDIKDIL